MRNRYVNAFVTSCLSILPIVIIIYILSLSNLAPIGFNLVTKTGLSDNYILLLIGAIVLIVGLALFQIGASKSLSKVGELMGSSLSKQSNLFIVIIFAFLLGMLITCAEPSIIIVGNQININTYLLIGSIAAGVGIFVVIGIIRIFMQKSLKMWYLIFYFMVFLLVCLLQVDENNHAFLPFIFDAGGITTGSATVPFILALGAGFAVVRGGKNARDNSFGLVGLASVGPIITMTILILCSPGGFEPYEFNIDSLSVGEKFLYALIPQSGSQLGTLVEVIMALAPIIIIFFIYELLFIKLSKKKVIQLLIGFVISYFGLVIFLTGVNAAMQPIGKLVGISIASQSDWVIILVAFILGLVTILCEPAVHVLTGQIENISDGQIKKRTVLIALSLGVGVAILLATIRTLFSFSIMYYIIPGYVISLILMFVVPDIFTAIAFDSGGTASGPMSVSFILPFIIGIFSVRGAATYDPTTEVIENGILVKSTRFYSEAFGVVALIALTPIIAIQILGFVNEIKNAKALSLMRKQVYDARNDEIIHFN